MNVSEGKNKNLKSPAPAPAAMPPGTMVVKTCELFNETFKEHAKQNRQLISKLIEFINFKKDNPTKLYKVDKSDSNIGSVYDSVIPGIRHAHLTHDISVWYKISGMNPRELKLYALLTHDESGTGEPVKKNVARGMAKRMSGQTFHDIEPGKLL